MADKKFELKDGQFTLHKQDPSKKKKESSPDFFGSAMIDGTEYRLSGWAKMKNDGSGTYISGYISLPQEQTAAPAEAVDEFMTTPAIEKAKSQPEETPCDDLPF